MEWWKILIIAAGCALAAFVLFVIIRATVKNWKSKGVRYATGYVAACIIAFIIEIRYVEKSELRDYFIFIAMLFGVIALLALDEDIGRKSEEELRKKQADLEAAEREAEFWRDQYRRASKEERNAEL